jgi:pimeloyl-ACP methyl ester carboxylesterase
MAGPSEARRRLEALLASATIHHSPCGDGTLQWQQWSEPSAGRPLLLLHGGYGSWNHWFANIETLRQHRELWTVDLPGLGESADIPWTSTPLDIAQILLAGLNTVWPRDQAFELSGFSFGGMVGARLAALAGPRCRRFVAIGAAGFGELHEQVELQAPPPPSAPWHEAEAVHRANLRALMFSEAATIDEQAVYLQAWNLERYCFHSRALSLTADFISTLPAICDRLHAIWGSEDATAGGTDALEARRVLLEATGAGFELLEGVGHWAMYESPARINQLLLG